MGISKFWYRGSAAIAATMMVVGVTSLAQGQSILTYNINKTSSTVVADGVIDEGEWDDASTEGGGDWQQLGQPFGTADVDNNRFRMQYDDDNLYVLYETDHSTWLEPLGGGNPNIVFTEDNLNLYIDPRADGELVNNVPNGEVDGYQLAFNQYSGPGPLISTDADRQGVGFFTEAHVDSPFGDQGGWNNGGSAVEGAALGNGSGITVAQNNTPGTGGLAEIIIPFDSLNAMAEIDDGNGGMKTTGLNQADVGTPANGDTWLFLMSTIPDDPSAPGGLPIWNWHEGGSFAPHGNVGHGEVTFVDPGASDPADLNMDGFVDGLDLGILLGNFGSNAAPGGGELDGTDPVDGLDLGILLGAWNPPPTVGASSVPEPASLALLALAGVAALSTRRSRS